MNIMLMWSNHTLNQNTPIVYNGISDTDVSNPPIHIDVSKWPTVDNQVRCYLWFDNKRNTFVSTPFAVQNGKYIRIALVVESPHKGEFTVDFSPLQPLNGVSGTVFDRKIADKMNSWFLGIENCSAIYEIKVFNPVQYQTSLFHFLNNMISYDRLSNQLVENTPIPRYSLYEKKSCESNIKMRELVWKTLFESNLTHCQTDFQKEIAKYWPDYLINACTGKSSYTPPANTWNMLSNIQNFNTGNSLKDEVRRSLYVFDDWFLKTIHYREESHPFHWQFEK